MGDPSQGDLVTLVSGQDQQEFRTYLDRLNSTALDNRQANDGRFVFDNYSGSTLRAFAQFVDAENCSGVVFASGTVSMADLAHLVRFAEEFGNVALLQSCLTQLTAMLDTDTVVELMNAAFACASQAYFQNDKVVEWCLVFLNRLERQPSVTSPPARRGSNDRPSSPNFCAHHNNVSGRFSALCDFFQSESARQFSKASMTKIVHAACDEKNFRKRIRLDRRMTMAFRAVVNWAGIDPTGESGGCSDEQRQLVRPLLEMISFTCMRQEDLERWVVPTKVFPSLLEGLLDEWVCEARKANEQMDWMPAEEFEAIVVAARKQDLSKCQGVTDQQMGVLFDLKLPKVIMAYLQTPANIVASFRRFNHADDRYRQTPP